MLLVRPIRHPPRTVPPRAADQRSQAYPTLLRVLRCGRYGQRGGPKTPEVGPLACVSCGHLLSRPPLWLCLLRWWFLRHSTLGWCGGGGGGSSSPLLAELLACVSPPLLAGGSRRWWRVVPRHSWLRVPGVAPRHSWLGSAGVAGGVALRHSSLRSAGLWGVVVAGGPSLLLTEVPGWAFPRHSWLGAPGAVPPQSWLGGSAGVGGGWPLATPG